MLRVVDGNERFAFGDDHSVGTVRFVRAAGVGTVGEPHIAGAVGPLVDAVVQVRRGRVTGIVGDDDAARCTRPGFACTALRSYWPRSYCR